MYSDVNRIHNTVREEKWERASWSDLKCKCKCKCDYRTRYTSWSFWFFSAKKKIDVTLCVVHSLSNGLSSSLSSSTMLLLLLFIAVHTGRVLMDTFQWIYSNELCFCVYVSLLLNSLPLTRSRSLFLSLFVCLVRSLYLHTLTVVCDLFSYCVWMDWQQQQQHIGTERHDTVHCMCMCVFTENCRWQMERHYDEWLYSTTKHWIR